MADISMETHLAIQGHIDHMSYRAVSAHSKTPIPGEGDTAHHELGRALGILPPPSWRGRGYGEAWFCYLLPNGHYTPYIYYHTSKDINGRNILTTQDPTRSKPIDGNKILYLTREHATDTLDTYIEGMLAHSDQERKIKQAYDTIKSRMRVILDSYTTLDAAIEARPYIGPFIPKGYHERRQHKAHEQPEDKELFVKVAAAYQILRLEEK